MVEKTCWFLFNRWTTGDLNGAVQEVHLVDEQITEDARAIAHHLSVSTQDTADACLTMFNIGLSKEKRKQEKITPRKK